MLRWIFFFEFIGCFGGGDEHHIESDHHTQNIYHWLLAGRVQKGLRHVNESRLSLKSSSREKQQTKMKNYEIDEWLSGKWRRETNNEKDIELLVPLLSVSENE